LCSWWRVGRAGRAGRVVRSVRVGRCGKGGGGGRAVKTLLVPLQKSWQSGKGKDGDWIGGRQERKGKEKHHCAHTHTSAFFLGFGEKGVREGEEKSKWVKGGNRDEVRMDLEGLTG
jgi:hypothetical protein